MITRTTRKLKEHLATLKVGDLITVVMPREDRQGFAIPRVPGAIHRIMQNGYFETGGVIDRKF